MTPEDFLRGMEPPPVPASLRERVLAEARHATPLDTGLVDRLWTNRPLWLGWAGVVLALLAGHASLSLGGSSPPLTAGKDPGEPAMDLGLPEAALPPLQAHQARRSMLGGERPRLIDVWLEPGSSRGRWRRTR
jgi:hypothetical protein